MSKKVTIEFHPSGKLVANGEVINLMYGDQITLNETWGFTTKEYLDDLVFFHQVASKQGFWQRLFHPVDTVQYKTTTLPEYLKRYNQDRRQ